MSGCSLWKIIEKAANYIPCSILIHIFVYVCSGARYFIYHVIIIFLENINEKLCVVGDDDDKTLSSKTYQQLQERGTNKNAHNTQTLCETRARDGKITFS